MPWKDYKTISSDLKIIYQTTTEDEALLALEHFGDKWNEKHHKISCLWITLWDNLNSLFSYTQESAELFTRPRCDRITEWRHQESDEETQAVRLIEYL